MGVCVVKSATDTYSAKTTDDHSVPPGGPSKEGVPQARRPNRFRGVQPRPITSDDGVVVEEADEPARPSNPPGNNGFASPALSSRPSPTPRRQGKQDRKERQLLDAAATPAQPPRSSPLLAPTNTLPDGFDFGELALYYGLLATPDSSTEHRTTTAVTVPVRIYESPLNSTLDIMTDFHDSGPDLKLKIVKPAGDRNYTTTESKHAFSMDKGGNKGNSKAKKETGGEQRRSPRQPTGRCAEEASVASNVVRPHNEKQLQTQVDPQKPSPPRCVAEDPSGQSLLYYDSDFSYFNRCVTDEASTSPKVAAAATPTRQAMSVLQMSGYQWDIFPATSSCDRAATSPSPTAANRRSVANNAGDNRGRSSEAATGDLLEMIAELDLPFLAGSTASNSPCPRRTKEDQSRTDASEEPAQSPVRATSRKTIVVTPPRRLQKGENAYSSPVHSQDVIYARRRPSQVSSHRIPRPPAVSAPPREGNPRPSPSSASSDNDSKPAVPRVVQAGGPRENGGQRDGNAVRPTTKEGDHSNKAAVPPLRGLSGPPPRDDHAGATTSAAGETDELCLTIPAGSDLLLQSRPSTPHNEKGGSESSAHPPSSRSGPQPYVLPDYHGAPPHRPQNHEARTRQPPHAVPLSLQQSSDAYVNSGNFSGPRQHRRPPSQRQASRSGSDSANPPRPMTATENSSGHHSPTSPPPPPLPPVSAAGRNQGTVRRSQDHTNATVTTLPAGTTLTGSLPSNTQLRRRPSVDGPAAAEVLPSAAGGAQKGQNARRPQPPRSANQLPQFPPRDVQEPRRTGTNSTAPRPGAAENPREGSSDAVVAPHSPLPARRNGGASGQPLRSSVATGSTSLTSAPPNRSSTLPGTSAPTGLPARANAQRPPPLNLTSIDEPQRHESVHVPSPPHRDDVLRASAARRGRAALPSPSHSSGRDSCETGDTNQRARLPPTRRGVRSSQSLPSPTDTMPARVLTDSERSDQRRQTVPASDFFRGDGGYGEMFNPSTVSYVRTPTTPPSMLSRA